MTARAIALQGIGFSPAYVGRQGFLAVEPIFIICGTSRGRQTLHNTRPTAASASRPAQVSATRIATVHKLRSNVQTSRR